MQKNKNNFKTEIALFGNVKVLVCTALMVALSAIFKTIAIPGGNVLRFSFENMPILFTSIAFGPLVGAACGVCSDFVGCMVMTYEVNPYVMIGAGAIGLVGGIIARLSSKLPELPRIVVTVVPAHFVGSVIIKTYGLAKFYAMTYQVLFLWRLLNYVIIATIEILILWYLLKNKAIKKQLASILESRRTEKKENTAMNYSEAVEYIHKINWTFCNPGLERITELCEMLGNPQNNLKFIHVAGTNGKGSFSSMLSSVLKEAGYKVGLFTSPYVKTFNERMAINSEMISNDELAEITSYVRPFADKMKDKPTEFELISAIAFEYFHRNKCDYVVLECGLGGRLDSTNIVTTTELSVITGIAFDHVSILGDTIEKIAYEKAGIIKAGVPCLWCGMNESAESIIKSKAEELSAPFYSVDHSLTRIEVFNLDGTVFSYKDHSEIEISLLGEYQPFNATNVLEAIDILRQIGISIDEKAVRNGLKNAKWPARFEILSKSPLIIADGGHNTEGVDSAVNSIRKYFGDQKINVVTGVMADKDYDYIADKIATVADRVFCLTPNNPRALAAKEYADVYNKKGVNANAYETVEDAVKFAIDDSKDTGKPLLCVGSLYMYSDIALCVENMLG